MKPVVSISKSTDQEINAAVAEYVAGWKRDPAQVDIHSKWRWIEPSGFKWSASVPNYTTDANAVLPLLEKCENVRIDRVTSNGWQVAILEIKPVYFNNMVGTEEGVTASAWCDTLAKTACFALLLAAGVTVND